MRWQSIVAVLIATAGVVAQAPSPTVVPPGTRFRAELRSKLDSRHAKVGDAVEAQVLGAVKLQGAVVIPSGALLSGQVTEVVAAESKKSPAHIAIHFTSFTEKHSAAIPFSAGIALILPPPPPPPPMTAAADAGLAATRIPTSDGALASPITAPTQRGTMSDGEQGAVPANNIGDQPIPDIVTSDNGAISSMVKTATGATIEVSIPPAPPSHQPNLGSVITSSRGDVTLAAGTEVMVQVLH